MNLELNDKEIEIIECMAGAWDEDGLLHGGLSSQMVYNLLTKLHIEIPTNLKNMCEFEDEYVEELEE
jgi:hypothetical protein